MSRPEPDAPPASDAPRDTAPWARNLRFAVLVLGLVALGLAAREAMDEAQDVTLPGPGALLAALVLTRLAIGCVARAWIHLVSHQGDTRELAATVYASQLTKYLPAGGLVQAAGQVGMTAMLGVSVREAALGYFALAVTSVAAGLTLSSSLAASDALPLAARMAALALLAAPLLAHRGVLGWGLDVARRFVRRVPSADDLPPQRGLTAAFVWSAVNLALFASGFAILLRAIDPSVPLLETTAGFVLAWVVGFLVVPLPSGLGVREAVLLAVVPVGTGPLLAASLAQRLVSIAAELLAAGGNALHRRLRPWRGRP